MGGEGRVRVWLAATMWVFASEGAGRTNLVHHELRQDGHRRAYW